jgi:cytochrome oxidase Cu insertion factor (SCO1/SenC/PrrC family)
MIEFLILAIFSGTPQSLPRPQIISAEGKPAPNFALKDQQGKTVRLAALRGKRVLLIFYRGYW